MPSGHVSFELPARLWKLVDFLQLLLQLILQHGLVVQQGLPPTVCQRFRDTVCVFSICQRIWCQRIGSISDHSPEPNQF